MKITDVKDQATLDIYVKKIIQIEEMRESNYDNSRKSTR